MTTDNTKEAQGGNAGDAPRVKIGFIGTGNMGKPMASNLIAAGYELTVYDKRKESTEELIARGARWADSCKAVAQASKVTFTSLPGPPEVEEVALGPEGILEGAHRGDYYIDLSTINPGTIRKVADAAAAKGVRVLDAPVTGGTRGARRATLTIMVGGSAADFEFCEPILKRIGARVVLMGDIGAGQATKLVNNMMSTSNELAAMEAMVIGAKAGVDVKKLCETLDTGSGGSFMLRNLFPYVIFKGKFEPPTFALGLAAKDLRLSVEYARELGVPIKVVQCVYDALEEAMKQGLGDKDHSSYITLLEKAAGVEVRAKD